MKLIYRKFLSAGFFILLAAVILKLGETTRRTCYRDSRQFEGKHDPQYKKFLFQQVSLGKSYCSPICDFICDGIDYPGKTDAPRRFDDGCIELPDHPDTSVILKKDYSTCDERYILLSEFKFLFSIPIFDYWNTVVKDCSSCLKQGMHQGDYKWIYESPIMPNYYSIHWWGFLGFILIMLAGHSMCCATTQQLTLVWPVPLPYVWEWFERQQ